MSENLRKKKFCTADGLVLERTYEPGDTLVTGSPERVGKPGEFPFTRGVDPEMHRRAFWIMGMYSGGGNA